MVFEILLTILLLVILYFFWSIIRYFTKEIIGFGFCAMCASVSSLWATNLIFGFLPEWITILLVGMSITGGMYALSKKIKEDYGLEIIAMEFLILLVFGFIAMVFLKFFYGL